MRALFAFKILFLVLLGEFLIKILKVPKFCSFSDHGLSKNK